MHGFPNGKTKQGICKSNVYSLNQRGKKYSKKMMKQSQKIDENY